MTAYVDCNTVTPEDLKKGKKHKMDERSSGFDVIALLWGIIAGMFLAKLLIGIRERADEAEAEMQREDEFVWTSRRNKIYISYDNPAVDAVGKPVIVPS